MLNRSERLPPSIDGIFVLFGFVFVGAEDEELMEHGPPVEDGQQAHVVENDGETREISR